MEGRGLRSMPVLLWVVFFTAAYGLVHTLFKIQLSRPLHVETLVGALAWLLAKALEAGTVWSLWTRKAWARWVATAYALACFLLVGAYSIGRLGLVRWLEYVTVGALYIGLVFPALALYAVHKRHRDWFQNPARPSGLEPS